MKTMIVLLTIFVLLVTMGLQPVSRGIMGGTRPQINHMNRLSNTLASVESGSDGMGNPSFDMGHSSWFN